MSGANGVNATVKPHAKIEHVNAPSQSHSWVGMSVRGPQLTTNHANQMNVMARAQKERRFLTVSIVTPRVMIYPTVKSSVRSANPAVNVKMD